MSDTTTIQGQPLTEERKEAIDGFLSVWWNDTLVYDVASSLSCREAEAMADLLRAFGHDGMANTFIECHAEADDEGDMHHPDYEPEEESA